MISDNRGNSERIDVPVTVEQTFFTEFTTGAGGGDSRLASAEGGGAAVHNDPDGRLVHDRRWFGTGKPLVVLD